jgi:hypothetical protein
MQINQIRGRLLIVTDQIAHQNVENVVVDGNGLFEARHNGKRMKKDEVNSPDAIPINGQHFLALYRGELWTI